MSDEPLKSAYELAMERLQDQDRQEGVKTQTPLSEAQKEQIAELRRQAKARHAELEILHSKNLSGSASDAEALTRIESEYETDQRRVESSLESGIVRVRRGESVSGLS